MPPWPVPAVQMLVQTVTDQIADLTPDPETEAEFVAEREAQRRAQKRRYWHETFAQNKRRVHGTLDKAEYEAMARRANTEGRSVWHQILAESRAYRAGEYVPSRAVETELQQLNVQCRKIGTNLNQLAKHSNRMRRYLGEPGVQAELRTLVARLRGAIASLWQQRPPPDER